MEEPENNVQVDGIIVAIKRGEYDTYITKYANDVRDDVKNITTAGITMSTSLNTS